MMNYMKGLAAAGGLCLVVAAPASAQAPAGPSVAPSFGALLAQVEGAAPTLEIGPAEVRAAQGRAEQARARPNPTVRVEVENVLGSRPYGGFGSAETSVSGELPLELGGRRGARIAAARADVSAAQARAMRSRIDYLRDLALAYGEAEAAQAKERLAVEHLRLAHSDAATARILVENGREAELRAIQADSATAAAIAEVEEAASARTGALGRLSALAGDAQGYSAVAGGLLDRPESLRSDLRGGAPEVAVAAAEVDAFAARLRSERLRRRPDLNVGIGLRRFEQEGAFAAIAGVSATLPLFDRNRGNIAAARADVSAAEARLRQANLSAGADLRSATAQAEAAELRVEAAAAGEQASAEAYRLARIGYDGGRIPLAELLSTRRALVEARERQVDARLARVRAEAELARAQGMIR